MKANEEAVGREMTHTTLGLVKVKEAIIDSRTLVLVEITGKGKGWNEEKQKYSGVKTKGGWYLGRNYSLGQETIVHIKDLK